MGISADSVRAKKYTKEVIIERLQRAARDGNNLLATTLAGIVDLKAVRREFGTLDAALRAAGLASHLQRRRHGSVRWTREHHGPFGT